MPLEIELLGVPAVREDGEPRPLRGQKVWGLLAYLLLEGPATRERLAELLFPDAADPLGSLRWNLAQLRRGLGPERVESSRELALALPGDAVVDVRILRDGTAADAVALRGLGRDLLEGVDLSASAGFDAWIGLERSRARGMAEAALHEAALARLAAADPRGAADAAVRLVALNPFDENFHELLVRSHAAAGDRAAARRAAEACTELLRRELGRDPGPAVAAAAADPRRIAPPPAGAASARAQLEAGTSAVDSGAVDAGISALRGAATAAAGCGDDALLARALFALGYALVHAVKGRDEEGAAALRRAALVAQSCGRDEIAVAASRELAYVEVLRGRYARALGLLDRIRPAALDDLPELASIESIAGMALADTGRHEAAAVRFGRAVGAAETAGETRRLAYALSMVGRLHLLAGANDQARGALTRSLELTQDDGWLAFVPWPEALLGELDRTEGDDESAADRFAHAFALGCHLEDPCWEGLAARGIALMEAETDPEAAIERLDAAQARALSAPDGYRWVGAYALDALCGVAVRHGDPRAAAWIGELHELAGRTGMRDLAASAYRHAGADEAAEAVSRSRTRSA